MSPQRCRHEKVKREKQEVVETDVWHVLPAVRVSSSRGARPRPHRLPHLAHPAVGTRAKRFFITPPFPACGDAFF